MEGIGKDIATSVGSGVILAVLGWLWITFSPLGKAFWEKSRQSRGHSSSFLLFPLLLRVMNSMPNSIPDMRGQWYDVIDHDTVKLSTQDKQMYDFKQQYTNEKGSFSGAISFRRC